MKVILRERRQEVFNLRLEADLLRTEADMHCMQVAGGRRSRRRWMDEEEFGGSLLNY